MGNEYSVDFVEEDNGVYKFEGSYPGRQNGAEKLSEQYIRAEFIGDDTAKIKIREEITVHQKSEKGPNEIQNHEDEIEVPEKEWDEPGSNDDDDTIQIDLSDGDEGQNTEKRRKRIRLEQACEEWVQDNIIP